MIVWMLFPTAEAMVSRTIRMCVDYDVDFTDAPDTAGTNGLGDFWDNNTVDRAGIGLAFELDTDVTTYSGRLRVQFPTPFEKAGSSIGTAEGPDLNEEVEEHETPPG